MTVPQILLADLDLAPELLNGSLTGLGIDHTDGADDSAAARLNSVIFILTVWPFSADMSPPLGIPV